MRSHYCGQITADLLGKEVKLAGWVHRRRDHGGVIFIDLRDREGIVQAIVNPLHQQAFAKAESLRSEFVILVQGHVRKRPQGTINPNLRTGEIEVEVIELTILNRADPLPFPIDDEYHDIGEETRLRYRYLDIRRPEMLERLKFRARIARYLRAYLDEHGFIDVETPLPVIEQASKEKELPIIERAEKVTQEKLTEREIALDAEKEAPLPVIEQASKEKELLIMEIQCEITLNMEKSSSSIQEKKANQSELHSLAMLGAFVGAAIAAPLAPFTFGGSMVVGAIIGAAIGGGMLGTIFGVCGTFFGSLASKYYKKNSPLITAEKLLDYPTGNPEPVQQPSATKGKGC